MRTTRQGILFAVLACFTFTCAVTAVEPERVVVLTFDDAVRSHATLAVPLLRKYGFGATFFICEFPPDFADKTKYMTWAQIRSLHEMGFEIANHTRTHAHVNKMSKTQMIEELEYIEKRCEEFGIEKPVSFAYPGYDTHPMALSTLPDKGYRFARTGGSRPYRPEVDDPLLIPSFSTTGSDKQRVMNALRQAGKGRIVVLTIHVVSGQQPGGDYLRNIIDIDAGIRHSIALEGSPDRYVWCWGNNSKGQMGNNSDQPSPSPVQVVGESGVGNLANIVDVAVTATATVIVPGNGASYAVEAINGYVWAWGDNYYSQLGRGNTGGESKTPVKVLSGEQDPAHEDTHLKDIVAISAGFAHVLALDKDGNVWAWGYNEYGQLGNGGYGSGAKETTPVKVKKKVDGIVSDLTNIFYIDAGWLYSTAIDENGKFWVWGINQKGQLGLGDIISPRPYAELMH